MRSAARTVVWETCNSAPKRTTPGNYIVFTGVTGSSFTTQTWGNGFNHIGPFGFQIRESAPASPYDAWANGTSTPPLPAKLPTDNQDGDSFTNLLEFGFAFNPTVSDGNLPLTISGGSITQNGPPQNYVDPGTGRYYLRYTRRADYVAAGLTYTAQFAADSLGAGAFEDVAGGSVAGTGTGADGVAIEAIAIEFPDALPGSGRKARFGRVEVEIP